MKELIFVMLFLCFLAIMEVNDTIIEVNSTPESKAKTAEQKKVELKAEEFLENERSGSRYFCENLFWASQPKQAAKT